MAVHQNRIICSPCAVKIDQFPEHCIDHGCAVNVQFFERALVYFLFATDIATAMYLINIDGPEVKHACLRNARSSMLECAERYVIVHAQEKYRTL